MYLSLDISGMPTFANRSVLLNPIPPYLLAFFQPPWSLFSWLLLRSSVLDSPVKVICFLNLGTEKHYSPRPDDLSPIQSIKQL